MEGDFDYSQVPHVVIAFIAEGAEVELKVGEYNIPEEGVLSSLIDLMRSHILDFPKRLGATVTDGRAGVSTAGSGPVAEVGESGPGVERQDEPGDPGFFRFGGTGRITPAPSIILPRPDGDSLALDALAGFPLGGNQVR